MTRGRPWVAAVAVATAALGGCGDGSSPGADDDDGACAPEPIDLTLDGGLEATVELGPPACALAGGTWTATWTSLDGWDLAVRWPQGPTGELLVDGVEVTLTTPQGEAWRGGGDEGLATVELDVADPPCGEWTVSALERPGEDFTTVAPHPFPLRCE